MYPKLVNLRVLKDNRELFCSVSIFTLICFLFDLFECRQYALFCVQTKTKQNDGLLQFSVYNVSTVYLPF